ncbi:Malonyl CoA-acyl carrier protein transacylase [Enhygromyxa salina]|uniref:Malonyl CoA-acyl carrier protein transacylase n=1 Tax=Enhygromyxa salina TaxID=215803 RepID=A0A0C2A4A4_9BACT|nr:ACP S-malonyltransferase [Enhygromyxa salina]KIG18198.1 Malonyl CoA-acyl carrier protein transacylase [Enhygromyxa salina]
MNTEQVVSTTAFMFPGQGTQTLGMGRALAREYPEARLVFEEADEALGESLSKLCFEGPEADLQQTEHTQPAILTTSIAALRVLEARTDIRPKLALGHSLGEISALVAVGSIRFWTAVRLARLRGQAMQEAVPTGGSMAAIIGLPIEQVEAMCQEASINGEIVSPANLNGANQIVVAGHHDAVERISDLAHDAEGRAISLKVSAPFHCALMQPAAERLTEWLEKVDIAPMRAPVISCVDAEPINDTDRVRGLLVAQVTHRVRWEESVRKALHMGCERAVELGNGNVLRGLLRRIDRGFKVYSLGEPADVDKLPKS